ncbi:unnamed protein product, partial [Symbiodinium necroappetens]
DGGGALVENFTQGPNTSAIFRSCRAGGGLHAKGGYQQEAGSSVLFEHCSAKGDGGGAHLNQTFTQGPNSSAIFRSCMAGQDGGGLDASNYQQEAGSSVLFENCSAETHQSVLAVEDKMSFAVSGQTLLLCLLTAFALATPSLGLGPLQRFYVVLRCAGLDCPALFSSGSNEQLLSSIEVLAEGHQKFMALTWPEEGRTAPVPEALAIPVMRRQEGLLFCIPCGFLSLATLDEGEGAEAQALMGPSHQCTLAFGSVDEQGVEQALDLELAVLLVDFGAEVVPLLRDLGEDLAGDSIFPFDLHQPDAFPLSDDLLAVAKRWVTEAGVDRTAFYSAQEEPPPEDPGPMGKAKAKKAAAKRKVTTSDLAQQMTLLTSMLPQLADQLSAVREKQESLEKQVQSGSIAAAPSPAKPAHQQPFLPAQGPGLPVAKHASLVGPPPRTKPQDATLNPAASAPTRSPAAAPGAAAQVPQDAFQEAMLQQSQALSALLGHLVSQQDGGLGDLSASSSTSYVGSKGAARRERLQGARAARFGGFAGQRETGYIMWWDFAWLLTLLEDKSVLSFVTGGMDHLRASVLEGLLLDFFVRCPPLDLLARPAPPSEVIFPAFGASVGEFALADSGRRNPQLVARLNELTAFLAASSAATGDAYADRSGTVVPTHNDAFPGLEPFRSLDVSRLRLSGRGSWDPSPHLPEELYMAFSEPRSLLHGLPPPESFVPVWSRESPREVASLAGLWDTLGLLRLAPATLALSESYLLARAFNCYKGPDKDRMIIDRRGQNWAESRLSGPSRFIPVGPMLGMLEVRPACQSIFCSAADRKDFYHQLGVSASKASSNALDPALPRAAVRRLDAFKHLQPSPCDSGTTAFGVTKEAASPSQRRPLLFDSDHYLVCFGAVAQGDHLGVEVGQASHEGLLISGGLLDPSERLCSNRPFKGLTGAQGLVIDDFFSVSVKAIYLREGLMGSDDKDILGKEHAKIAGAEINSSLFARSRGLVTVAAPAAKRAALAMVSLETARLSHVTDALWLSVVGSWTSAALFRRPLMSVLASVYEVAPASAVKTGHPVLYSLSRAAAQELVLVSLLSPLASCDLAAPLKPDIYATDASELKGGYTVARAGVDIVRPLWRTASKKGGYSRLLSKEEAVLARFDDREPFDLRMQGSSVPSGPQRPLAYFFDFLEVSSCGLVSSLLADRGRAVGLLSGSFTYCSMAELRLAKIWQNDRGPIDPSFWYFSSSLLALTPPRFQLRVVVVLALATVFDSVLRRVSHVRWRAGDDWCWKSAAHINILEAASILRLVRALAPSGPCRVVILVDSAVALHSCAKGRSPSRGLTPVLRKIAALCLIAGVFPAFHFVPTRLNPGGPRIGLVWSAFASSRLLPFGLTLAGVDFSGLLDLAPSSTKLLNRFLVSYGRQLFEAGADSFYHFGFDVGLAEGGRSDLLLPQDVSNTISYALISISRSDDFWSFVSGLQALALFPLDFAFKGRSELGEPPGFFKLQRIPSWFADAVGAFSVSTAAVGLDAYRQKLPSFYKLLQWDNRLRRRSAEKVALQGWGGGGASVENFTQGPNSSAIFRSCRTGLDGGGPHAKGGYQHEAGSSVLFEHCSADRDGGGVITERLEGNGSMHFKACRAH